jgi:hypothetical protein
MEEVGTTKKQPPTAGGCICRQCKKRNEPAPDPSLNHCPIAGNRSGGRGSIVCRARFAYPSPLYNEEESGKESRIVYAARKHLFVHHRL